MRSLVCGTAILLVGLPLRSAEPTMPRPETADSVAARVDAIASEYLAARRAAFPEAASDDGGPAARHDRLRDVSADAERAWWTREERWLAELRVLDGQVPLDHPAWITYGLLREQLESRTALRVCRNRLWTVNPLVGWHSEYATLAAQQPVGTPELREQALARWRRLPRLVDQEIANLREGVALGYTAPKPNVHRVLAVLDRMLTLPPTASPFFSPADRDSTPAFRAAFEQLVADEITPAVRRYRDYLADEYLAVARQDVGLGGHPEGAACYRAAIRRYTTLDLSGEELHELALRELAAAESTLTIVRASPGTMGQAFVSRAAMRAAVDTILARAWAAVPRWFHRAPAGELVVESVPAFEDGAVPIGRYLLPADDGSRPGVFQVSLQQAVIPGSRSRLERITFHEAVPGHHFQISFGRERPAAHPVTRVLVTDAFVEGWAVYAEHLAEEMGLYTSAASRADAAGEAVTGVATLAAETGLHARGWSRAQAIEFLMRHATMSQAAAAATVDRAAGWPGQGLAYELGNLEIRRLRDLAERALGARFDIREFHERVLEDGAVTLPMLRAKIEAWAHRQRAGRRKAADS